MVDRPVQESTVRRFSDVYIEKALLGRILLDREIPRTLRFLEPADFCDPLNRAIYAAICALQDQGEEVDFALITDQMRQDKTQNDLELAGGLFYFCECMDLYPVLGGGQVYAQRIVDLVRKRRDRSKET